MKNLLSELPEISQSIQWTETNSKKMEKSNIKKAITKNRLELLDDRSQKCENSHLQIKSLTSSVEREKIDYFTKSKFRLIKGMYLSAYDFLINQLDLFIPEHAGA